MRFLPLLSWFVAWVAWPAVVCSGADPAEQLYKDGQRAERAGDSFQAYLLYARAAELEPRNPVFAARKAALGAIAAIDAQTDRLGPLPDDAEEGAAPLGRPTGQEILEAREALPPPSLAASPDKKSFDLRGDARTIFEQVAAAYGLMTVFDGEYQPPPPFVFRMSEAGYQDALRGLEAQSNSFVVPVSPRMMLVARDTPQKRAILAPVMAAGFPIPGRMSVQEAQEIITAVQQTLDIRRASVDPGRHVVYLRDQAAKIEAARHLFHDLSQLRPKVELDVEFLSVDRRSSRSYGLNLPSSFPLLDFGNFMHSAPASPAGFTQFLSFGGGSTFIGLGIGAASAMATQNQSTAATLLHAQMVSADGQAATLHVGDRYPIITNGYYGNSTGTGQVFAPPPTVNYQDLGLVLKVTPSVHDGQEVTLDLDSEFSVLGAASSISGIPVISSRKFTGKVRLKEGEWAVIAGLIQLTESDTRSGWPGLSSLPGVGRLFRSNTHEKDSTEVLLVLKPRIVTLPPWEFPHPPLWVGTETRPLTLF